LTKINYANKSAHHLINEARGIVSSNSTNNTANENNEKKEKKSL
jgi:hypothetical protein